MTHEMDDDTFRRAMDELTGAMAYFEEEPVRILRCIREAANASSPLFDLRMLAAMRGNARRLAEVPQRAVTDELCQMLVGERPALAMRLLLEADALQYVLPEMVETIEMTQNQYHCATVWGHTLAVLEGVKSRELSVRLAALLHDVGKVAARTVSADGGVHFVGHEVESGRIAERVLTRMGLPRPLIDEVCFLAVNHMKLKQYGDTLSGMRPKRLRKLLYLCGCRERFLRLADLIHADNNAHAPGHCLPRQIPLLIERAKAEERMYSYRLPITVDDVMRHCDVQRPEDVKLYWQHALVMAFAKPEMTREEFINDFKHFKLNR